MNQAQMIHQNSGVTEYHTPLDIVDVARALLGGTIDLDPASNPLANASIRAATIYTRFDDGLSKNWVGRVFMNHPFSSPERACKPNCRKIVCKRRGYCTDVDLPGNADWISKLVGSYEFGDVTSACCICFAATSEQWFAPLMRYPQMYFTGRVNYYLANGDLTEGVPKGSVLTYFPPKSMSLPLAGTLMKHIFGMGTRRGIVKIEA